MALNSSSSWLHLSQAGLQASATMPGIVYAFLAIGDTGIEFTVTVLAVFLASHFTVNSICSTPLNNLCRHWKPKWNKKDT